MSFIEIFVHLFIGADGHLCLNLFNYCSVNSYLAIFLHNLPQCALIVPLRFVTFFIQIITGCSTNDISFSFFLSQDYPKLTATYYVLLECLAQDHMVFLSTLEPRVFLYILSSISEGLTALGALKDSYTGLCG